MIQIPGASGAKPPPEGNIYIVTEDLSILVPRTAERLGIQGSVLEAVLNESFFQELLNDLVRAIGKYCFPEGEVKVKDLPHSSFDDLLRKHDRKATGKFSEFWLCLDSVYPELDCGKEESYPFSITRYVDATLDDIDDRGPRPEDKGESIHEQIAECIVKLNRISGSRESVDPVIIDDGTFDGKTIITILNEFAKDNRFIDSVRLGVAKLGGLFAITDWNATDKNGRIHRVSFVGATKFCPPIYDWVCERDFFPGILYSGKVIGEKIGELLQPRRVGERQTPVRAQYLYGWGNIEGWARLSKGNPRFTYEALGLSITLWERIQALTEKPILVEDLPAIPWKIYSQDPDEMSKTLKRPWLEVLKEERKAIRKGSWPW